MNMIYLNSYSARLYVLCLVVIYINIQNMDFSGKGYPILI